MRRAEGPRVSTEHPHENLHSNHEKPQKAQIDSNALFFAGCPHVRERRAEGPGVSIEKPLTSKICQVLEKKDQKYQWATD